MKTVIISLIIALCVFAYDAFRPIKTVTTHYRVQSGDTLYSICNDAYIVENNAECFNEFLDSNYKTNNTRLFIGDSVIITNKIYK